MSAFQSLLCRYFGPIAKLDSQQLAKLENHYGLLSRWNIRMNLTTTVDLEDAVLRHYCESLFVGTHVPPETGSLVDVGSGAGFPGYPIGVLRPDCPVTLVESNARKCVFLRESSRELTNVGVLEARAESIQTAYDCVVARAVNWKTLLPSLSRLGTRLMLMISGADSQRLMDQLHVNWQSPVPIPWGRDQILLIGDVPRETCSTEVSRGTGRGTISKDFPADGQGNRGCQPKGRRRKDDDRH